MSEIRLETRDGKLYMFAPYNRNCPSAAKARGGRWDADEKAWVFPEASRPTVLKLLKNIYNWQPYEDGAEPTITIQIDADELEDWYLCGVELCHRPGRDVPVVLSNGVSVVSGRFDSWGGSVKHPSPTYSGTLIMQIEGFTKSQLDDFFKGKQPYKIIAKTVNREELEAEKARLLARVAEIEKLLGKRK